MRKELKKLQKLRFVLSDWWEVRHEGGDGTQVSGQGVLVGKGAIQ